MIDVSEIEHRIVSVLKEIEPYLAQDQGGVEFVRFETETNVAVLKFTGKCRECPLQLMTLRGGIERYLLKRIPEIRRVESER